jgi:hypothetical protein
MTDRARRQPGRDAPAEIDRHNFRVKAMVGDFAINPRFRREIEGALRRGPMAVFALLDEIAYAQDLADAAAMIEGVADFPSPDHVVLRQTLSNAMTLIEGVQKSLEVGFLERRRP